ncbi:MAG TPA: adenylyltransferase/cytidyltransferase family protein [Leptolinea sp.]
MKIAVVSGRFDNLKSSEVRLLEEASKFGSTYAFAWSDELINYMDLQYPIFPLDERKYLLEGIRYIDHVHVVDQPFDPDTLPIINKKDTVTWVVDEVNNNLQKLQYCAKQGIKYFVVKEAELKSFPNQQNLVIDASPHLKKVVVTGSFDWLHSGHFRFFEEAATLGELFVVVGSDRNVCLLKGEGHPLFSQDERRYMVQSVRFVKQALISSGSGWMDAEPEIALIKPDMYVVNEDGDKPEKRRFCKEHNIEYIVLKRIPKEGLPKRESTRLRGF